jgi:soluble lytic murein transglycosylase
MFFKQEKDLHRELLNKTLMKRLVLAAVLGMTFFVIPRAYADIYLYVDNEGVLHFTNVPTSSDYKTFMPEKIKRTGKWKNNKNYDDVIAEAARLHDVSFPLLKALIHVESYFNPKAVSNKGAMGLCQIMPQNLEPLDIGDPFDPWQNVMGGARYLKAMLNRFDGKLSLALAAYNAGPTAVERYNAIPPYPETQNYVEKVMKFFNIYKES